MSKVREFMHAHPDGDLVRQDGGRYFHCVDKSAYTFVVNELNQMYAYNKIAVDALERIAVVGDGCEDYIAKEVLAKIREPIIKKQPRTQLPHAWVKCKITLRGGK